METKAIHSEEIQQVINQYKNSIDIELLNFVKDVMDGRDVLPLTVGFVSETMANAIYEATGIKTCGNRIMINADAIRHILNRHGESGSADHSMKDINDIARLSYVLSNYDSIEWTGSSSSHYLTKDGEKAPHMVISKRVNGTYYIVEAVTDSKKKRNMVVSAYLKKADE